MGQPVDSELAVPGEARHAGSALAGGHRVSRTAGEVQRQRRVIGRDTLAAISAGERRAIRLDRAREIAISLLAAGNPAERVRREIRLAGLLRKLQAFGSESEDTWDVEPVELGVRQDQG